MAQTYSTYEAKARFSETIRKVRAGQRIIISHGDERLPRSGRWPNRMGAWRIGWNAWRKKVSLVRITPLLAG